MGARRKVFGLGYNKTGTSTLGACLRRLGYRHVSHRADMLQALLAGDVARLIRETHGFDSCEDWPWPLIYRQLHAEYGDEACYVLTTRATPEIWLESLKRHCLNTHPVHPMRAAVFGYKYPHGYEAEHLALYNAHNDAVRAFFAARPSAPFLEICWETGDGWEKLCRFLGETEPDEPLPHIRPRAEGVDPRIRAQNQANIEAQLASLAARVPQSSLYD